VDHRRVGGGDHRARADDRRDHTATVDVADEDHGDVGGAREAHVGDVARAQVDFGRAARAFDDDEVAAGGQPFEAVEHVDQQPVATLAPARGGERAAHLAADDELRRAVALRLEQDRVHVDAGRDAAGDRLGRLRAADLATVGGDGGVVRHVLRLERSDRQPAIGEGAAQARDEHRLADVRAGPLEHQSAHASPPAMTSSNTHARR
jgi:hypothetical protein